MRTVLFRKFCLTRDLDRGLGAISKKREREGESLELGRSEGLGGLGERPRLCCWTTGGSDNDLKNLGQKDKY